MVLVKQFTTHLKVGHLILSSEELSCYTQIDQSHNKLAKLLINNQMEQKASRMSCTFTNVLFQTNILARGFTFSSTLKLFALSRF